MKKYLALFALSAVILYSAYYFSSDVIATETPVPVPESFTFKGQPVNPGCIDKFTGDSSRFEPIWLDTNECQQTKRDYTQEKLTHGFIGFEPVYKDAPGSYVYYKYLGKIHFQELDAPTYNLIYVENSGGGTGAFSSINVVDLNNDVLRLIDTIDGGDRCNGGLSSVEFKDNTLIYKKNVTPLALYSNAQKTATPNQNFADCAACCVGKVRFKNGQVNTFEFDQDVLDHLKADPKSPQDCFNQIIKETIDGGKSLLTPDELKAFGVRVKERCAVVEQK